MKTKTSTTKKATLATVKAFAKKNANNLFVRYISEFDGMCDGVRDCPNNQNIKEVSGRLDMTTNWSNKMDWNIGVWVTGSGNIITPVTDLPGYTGYNVYNCCGEFEILSKL